MTDTQEFQKIVKQLDDAQIALDVFEQQNADLLDQWRALNNEVDQCKAGISNFAKTGLEVPTSEKFSIKLAVKKTYNIEKFIEKLGVRSDPFLKIKQEVATAAVTAALKKGELAEQDIDGTYTDSSYYLIKIRTNELNEIEI